jgi:hypothetical protein
MRNRTRAREVERQWHHWTEEEARGVLAELGASGESVAGFCRRTGIGRQRIAYWRKRVSGPPEKPGATDFVAVDLAGVTGAKWLELVAGSVVLRVREELDVDHVARLVEAIRRRVGDPC